MKDTFEKWLDNHNEVVSDTDNPITWALYEQYTEDTAVAEYETETRLYWSQLIDED